jgi:hypothetical protein
VSAPLSFGAASEVRVQQHLLRKKRMTMRDFKGVVLGIYNG